MQKYCKKTCKKQLTKRPRAVIITYVVRNDSPENPKYGGLAQLGARLVSKHTPSQIVLRQSNSQQKTPSKRFASWILWGISSAGRALAWHARGQRFDPAILHQKSTVLRLKYGAFLFASSKNRPKISRRMNGTPILQVLECSPPILAVSLFLKMLVSIPTAL